MERSPNISWLFHTRLLSLLSLLSLADMTGVKLAYDTTTTKGASVQLVFGFEYAILLVSVLNVAIKYILHVVDYIRANANNNRDNGVNTRNWEEKAVYLLYSELALSASKVVLYLTFISLMMKIHTFPLFAIRPMYLSMRSFKKALNDVIQSRRAIANMNSLYPNASAQELLETDNVCIICREEMVGTTVVNGQVIQPPSGLSKKLPCGHIFHVSCLRSWFQRQQTCPTCRLDVLRAGIAARNNNNNNNNNNNVIPNNNNNNVNAGGIRGQGPAVNDAAQQQLMQQMFLTHLFLNQLQAGVNRGNNPVNTAPNSRQTSSTSNPSNTATTSSTAENVPTSTTTTTPASAGLFSMPLPPSNVNLSSLSDDELRRLIRTEREGLEARLRLYSQSRILIDAAITNLMQFNSMLESTGGIIRAPASNTEQELRSEDRTGVNIPSDLTTGDDVQSGIDSDGRILSEEEMFRRRTNSDVRRVRVSRFTREINGDSSANQSRGEEGEDVSSSDNQSAPSDNDSSRKTQ